MALLPLTFAYILHLPDFRAFTTPLFETLAMDLLPLLHLAFRQVPLTFSLMLLPTIRVTDLRFNLTRDLELAFSMESLGIVMVTVQMNS